MPQRTANLASVAMLAGPATPILTGQTTPCARKDAIQRRIGAGSKAN